MIQRQWSHGQRQLTWCDHTIAVLGPMASSVTLVWLASHRERLHTLLLGSWRLSLLIIWDTRGRERVKRTDDEIEAMTRIVHGTPPRP